MIQDSSNTIANIMFEESNIMIVMMVLVDNTDHMIITIIGIVCNFS